MREVEKLNRKGATAIRLDLRLQLETERIAEQEDLSSFSEEPLIIFLSSRKRAKVIPASSKKNSNSKIEKQLA
jgi:hypothetical protein